MVVRPACHAGYADHFGLEQASGSVGGQARVAAG
jgi:hypothetical protein